MESAERKYRILCPVLLCLLSLYILYNITNPGLKKFNPSTNTSSTTLLRLNVSLQKGKFIVNTPNCKIPNLDPFDISIRSLLKKGTATFKCDRFKNKLFTYQLDNKVYINYTVVNSSSHSKTFKGCYILPIYRPVDNLSDHNSKGFLPKSELFTTFIKAEHEYVLVQCVNNKGELINENFFSFVVKKESVESRCRTRLKQRRRKSRDTFSVMIIGLDSVSRLNAVRYLKKTRKYILDEMKAIELFGYHKVGDGTFDNIVPLLTGKFPRELPWTFKLNNVFDEYNFIWKNFSEHGYRTLFLEDFSRVAIFDNLRPGFHFTPADYYNRHFHLMMEEKLHLWDKNKICFADKSETEIVTNFTYRFMTTFKNDPYFGFVFITRLTHAVLERTAAADDIYYNFFREIHRNNLLKNTFLIFLSDHGIRFSEHRSYPIGKMEERLPMFYVIPPEVFRIRYPLLFNNLLDNSLKLTTHFDVHKTLLNILSLTKEYGTDKRSTSNKSRAYSLFRKIPEDRTCQDANIALHWCTCSTLQKVSLSNKYVSEGAKYLIGNINSLLSDFNNVCMPLRLQQVDAAYEFATGNIELYERQDVLQLNIKATPGGAKFEGTVNFDKKTYKFTLSGEISRINSYAKEKRCLVDHKLEKLCYCRSNMSQ